MFFYICMLNKHLFGSEIEFESKSESESEFESESESESCKHAFGMDIHVAVCLTLY